MTNKTLYFMAGLPRAGSTVLSAILNQNPRFYSGPSSPVLPAMLTMENHLQTNELYLGFPKPEQAMELISSIIEHYYSDIDKPVIIDKNRAWAGRIPFIEGYLKTKAKIICPVRDYDEILTSLISMIRRNPYKEGNQKLNFIDEQLVKLNIPLTDDNRCEFIASPNGILGQSLNSIIEAVKQGFKDKLHFVEYKDLIENPVDTLKSLYEFLEEEYFEHSFENLTAPNREDDMRTYGISDMHQVHRQLKKVSLEPNKVLSEKILSRCKGMDVWRNFNNQSEGEQNAN